MQNYRKSKAIEKHLSCGSGGRSKEIKQKVNTQVVSN